MIIKSRVLFVLIFLCLFIVALIGGFLSPIRIVFVEFFLPITRFTSSITQNFSRTTDRIFGVDERARINDLTDRLSRLSIDYVRLKMLEDENDDLRKQAKFLQKSGFDSVGARVISRDMNAGRARLLIDRGVHNEVQKGQAVIVGDGWLVGKVRSVSERTAVVDLISDPQSRIIASVLGDKKLIGVVEGRSGGAAQLTYIQSSVSLTRDQVIVTAGTDANVPAGLIIGVINAVLGKPTDAFLSASIEPFVSLNNISLVSVLRPSVFSPSI